MQHFWQFARRLMRYRWLVAAALAMAAISAGSLGAGLVAVQPVLEGIFGQSRELPEIVGSLNDKGPLKGWFSPEFIASLPTGRFTAVAWVMAILGVLTIFGGTAAFLHLYLSLTVVQRTVTNIRRQAFRSVIKRPLREVVVGGTSDSVSRIVNDTSTLEVGLTALLSKAAAQLTKGMAAFIAALVVQWWLTLVAVPVAIVLYVVIRRLGKRIRRASRSALNSVANLYGAAAESLAGLRVVKVHTTERYESGRFHRINKDVMRQMMRARTARALASPMVEVLAVFALGTLSLAAVWLISRGALDPQRFLTAIIALFVAAAALKPLTGLLNDVYTADAAAGRLAELLAAPPEPGHDPSLPKLARHAESIEFQAVSLTYPGAERPALDRVSLRIAHGERVAFVGPNGSGKTSLLSLVPRLFDPDLPELRDGTGASPAVRIDGSDIRGFSVRSVRTQIGVVTQETVLFRGTVRSNIAYGADDASDERIVAAAKRARAHDFISALPKGYETLVGDQGLTLSGGQRQRIAIARAVLRDPAILILDEATSMIDADSEARIAEAIADFSAGRTCLIVAHRLSTVVSADRIVVMDEGRVVDEGRHEDLLDRCEVYRTIAETQLLGRAARGEARVETVIR